MSNPAGAQPLSAINLERVLADARLAAYRRSASDSYRLLMGRYRWNVALCMSLYPGLCHLEVAFRNSLHRALTHFAGSPAWYDANPVFLARREQDEVVAVRSELLKQRQRRMKATPFVADDMVAALKFGFWTSLLDSPYEQVFWNKRDMWALSFPRLNRRAQVRNLVSKRLHRIRQLRNRVFHYEPIWHWGDLRQQHQELQETIAWFELDLIRLLPDTHTFDDVFAQGPAAHELDVK